MNENESMTDMIKSARENKFVVKQTVIPELLNFYSQGKTADNYIIGDKRIIIRTDRISAKDYVLQNQFIVFKGEALTDMTYNAFKNSSVPNAMISRPDPNIMIQKNCKVFPVEFVVRGFLTGSLYSKFYSKNIENPWGPLPSGLKEFDQLEDLFFTPTTKAATGHDEPISEEAITKDVDGKSLMKKEDLAVTKEYALKLFEEGMKQAKAKNHYLVDAKYEMGIVLELKDGKLVPTGEIVALDEAHTPDAVRWWEINNYNERVAKGKAPDNKSKELFRAIQDKNGFSDKYKALLPITDEQELEVELMYVTTDSEFGNGIHYNSETNEDLNKRITRNLQKEGLIKGGCAIIMAASIEDKNHYDEIIKSLNELGVPYYMPEPLSGHKETQKVLDNLELYNKSIEPIVYINVTGRSNGLGPIISGKVRKDGKFFPNIACPVFKDKATMQIDLMSNMRMPSKIDMLTGLDTEDVALASRNILKMSGMT